MVLMIDNYDSFTYNLVQYVGELGYDTQVVRNDEVTVEDVGTLKPTHVIISPGPGDPTAAGISVDVIRRWADTLPILGVCLGHQCLAHAFGGNVVRAARLMHGKTSPVYHLGTGIFRGLTNPFVATRYHSLIVEEESLPQQLQVIAYTSEGEVMAIQLRGRPVVGVQFHPESILTEHGHALLKNFLNGR
ncbi:MAG TPA: aminodeoxychorismate/anthranilate synthase component II [Candidatus Deferrimicrobium sp.]|nr:aminodeoxychorismate/anthranilate synthase component II [Candidatus Deferrimicrobium sp.]